MLCPSALCARTNNSHSSNSMCTSTPAGFGALLLCAPVACDLVVRAPWHLRCDAHPADAAVLRPVALHSRCQLLVLLCTCPPICESVAHHVAGTGDMLGNADAHCDVACASCSGAASEARAAQASMQARSSRTSDMAQCTRKVFFPCCPLDWRAASLREAGKLQDETATWGSAGG